MYVCMYVCIYVLYDTFCHVYIYILYRTPSADIQEALGMRVFAVSFALSIYIHRCMLGICL